jgi:AraC family transcriptional regulator of adaptative response/methylated-DNA-[protein]-cysteine methyltransferase
MKALPPVPEMRRAFLRGDASYDGVFYTGVRTTGIFCRPSCTARKPRPENVEFFATPREASFSGYRPCKRCRPLDADGRPPEWVRRLLERIDASPAARIRTADLRSIGIDPARARRYFVSHYGMTFQAYCRARRLGDAFRLIKEGATVSEVANESGFESESGFRAAFARAFGTTPGEATSGDAIALDWIPSPVGPLVAGANSEGLCLLEFSDRRMLETQLETLRRRVGRVLVPGRNRWLEVLRTQLGEYFDGRRQDFDLPLVIRGTVFQEKVWRALLTIPYGETWSYRRLAERDESHRDRHPLSSRRERRRQARRIRGRRVAQTAATRPRARTGSPADRHRGPGPGCRATPCPLNPLERIRNDQTVPRAPGARVVSVQGRDPRALR